MISNTFTITNKVGLHVRPAGVFTNAVKRFQSSVRLACRGKDVDGKSIIAVMSAAIKNGDEITVTVDGPDEEEAMNVIGGLIQNKFGEAE